MFSVSFRVRVPNYANNTKLFVNGSLYSTTPIAGTVHVVNKNWDDHYYGGMKAEVLVCSRTKRTADAFEWEQVSV